MRDAAAFIASQRADFGPTFAARLATAITGFLGRLVARRRGRRTVTELGILEDHLLLDIGLTRADLEAETRRGTFAGVDRRLAERARRRREERWC